MQILREKAKRFSLSKQCDVTSTLHMHSNYSNKRTFDFTISQESVVPEQRRIPANYKYESCNME